MAIKIKNMAIKTKIKDSENHYIKHNFIECFCGKEHCRICSETENVCTKCGLSKDMLTTHCCGVTLTKEKVEAVKNGILDFNACEGWIRKNELSVAVSDKETNGTTGWTQQDFVGFLDDTLKALKTEETDDVETCPSAQCDSDLYDVNGENKYNYDRKPKRFDVNANANHYPAEGVVKAYRDDQDDYVNRMRHISAELETEEYDVPNISGVISHIGGSKVGPDCESTPEQTGGSNWGYHTCPSISPPKESPKIETIHRKRIKMEQDFKKLKRPRKK